MQSVYLIVRFKLLDKMIEGDDLVNESLDSEFIRALEDYLDNILVRFQDKRINSLSTDGILLPWMDKHLSRKSVNNTRQIPGITVFFLGLEKRSGNTAYELTLKLGKYALRRYAKGTSLTDSIPDTSSNEWITVDSENRKLELRLK